MADLLEDERSGLLVQRGDVNAIARGMLRLHDDASLAQRLGDVGQQLVTTHFDATTFAKSLDDIYRQTFRGQRVVAKPQSAVPQTQSPARTAAPITHH